MSLQITEQNGVAGASHNPTAKVKTVKQTRKFGYSEERVVVGEVAEASKFGFSEKNPQERRYVYKVLFYFDPIEQCSKCKKICLKSSQ